MQAVSRLSCRVRASGAPLGYCDDREYWLREIGEAVSDAETHGEWINLLRTRGPGTQQFVRALRAVATEPGGKKLGLEAVLKRILQENALPIRVLYIPQGWAKVNGLPEPYYHASV